MTAAPHDVRVEDVMALLDGELPRGDAERVRAHLAGCLQCQQVSSQVEGVSQRLIAWDVPSAPASLEPPRPRDSTSRYRRWLPLAAAIALAATAVLWVGVNGPLPSRSARQAEVAESVHVGGAESVELMAQGRTTAAVPLSLDELKAQRVVSGPQLARTARLALVCADVEATRAKIEGLVTGSGGYIDRIDASDADGRGLSITATLRIPTDRLSETLIAIKALGRVTSERQEGEDVAQQSADLDARLSNARTSEARLRAILGNRTATVPQVLEVEREITRVRGEIERMEAQRKSLDVRIGYAILSLDLSGERKPGVDLGPVPLSSRVRDAFMDGWNAWLTAVVEFALVAVQLLPTILTIIVVATPIAWWFRRRSRT